MPGFLVKNSISYMTASSSVFQVSIGEYESGVSGVVILRPAGGGVRRCEDASWRGVKRSAVSMMTRHAKPRMAAKRWRRLW